LVDNNSACDMTFRSPASSFIDTQSESNTMKAVY